MDSQAQDFTSAGTVDDTAGLWHELYPLLIELTAPALPSGAVIDVSMGSADRDESRWDRPEEFDIFRTRLPHFFGRPFRSPTAIPVTFPPKS